MPDRQISQLQLLLATEADLELSEREFKTGEKVKVKAGPLMGLTGELVEFRSEKKFMIRLDYTGQVVMVQIPAVYLEPFD